MRLKTSILAAAVATSLTAGCSGAGTGEPAAATTDGTGAFAWPASLTVVGDGFPAPGNPCRRIGETAATIDLLDDSAALVGCPTREDADKLGGRFLKTVDGVVLISVPNGVTAGGGGDALVAGTNYNATAQVTCSGYKGSAPGKCDADGTAAMAISSQKKGDVTIARIGTEAYEIPDAFVMGG